VERSSSSTASDDAEHSMCERAGLSAPASVVRELLAAPEVALDYATAKLVLDKLVEPQIDTRTTLLEVEQLVEAAREMAGSLPSNDAALLAIRRTLHERGPWNEGRPCAYDHSDPLGQDLRNSLLSNYLKTRRGSCVSMPILFLIMSERLGLNVSLAAAPLHLFVRYRDDQGRVYNLETTSGGLPARDEWYAANLSMTPEALKNGLYMRSLTRREAVAHMANTVVEHLITQGDYEAAVDVADVILLHWPRDAHGMVKKATAIAGLLEAKLGLLAPPSKQRMAWLAHQNEILFRSAEELGWTPLE
jgi:regulator of sirC expression with transglutaminase-like and TPR domain